MVIKPTNFEAFLSSAQIFRGSKREDQIGRVAISVKEMDPSRRKCGVALRLEPRFADDLRLGVGRRGVALLDERRVTLLHRVVVGHLAKVDLARLPKALLALLLLHCDLFRKGRCAVYVTFGLVATFVTSVASRNPQAFLADTGRLDSMSHRKWRETKQQPSIAMSGKR